MSIKSTSQERLPQAPRAPLPELAEFLAPLRVHFTQGPSAETLCQYLTGLLSEHPNKNCDTLAGVVPETTEQQFHHLLTDMVWDETSLNHQRIAQMWTLPSEGDEVLIFDDTGFEKQGRHSVGVARQYTGTAGKVTNCQVTVNCHYAERTLAWPLATRLYLPQAWAEDAARRKQAHVPEDITFQTKAEIALALLDEANACGVVPGDGKYFWSDFPAHTPLAVLVEYAHRRHWVEQYHEEAKTELGWDQYQGRRWDGYHRHAITMMLSYSFLVWLEGWEREQRKVSGRSRAAAACRCPKSIAG